MSTIVICQVCMMYICTIDIKCELKAIRLGNLNANELIRIHKRNLVTQNIPKSKHL